MGVLRWLIRQGDVVTLVALLKTMKPLEENFPEIDDPAPAPEGVF